MAFGKFSIYNYPDYRKALKNIIEKLHKIKTRIGRIFLPILFPRHCPVCRKIVSYGHKVCLSCYHKLPFVMYPTCYRCGKPISDPAMEYCYDCRIFPKTFQAGCSLFLYNQLTQPAMVDYKYHNRRVLTDFYIEEFLYRYYPLMKSWGIQAVIPVPVHSSKKKKRGYNQAELLSAAIADALNIAHYPDLLIRRINTLPQKQFTPQARLNNLRKAFTINPDYMVMRKKPARLLLVDDIYTTGATMEACTRALHHFGIEQVYVCSICIGASRDG